MAETTEHQTYSMFCKDRFDKMEKQLSDIHKVMVGNGTPGIDERVRKHDGYFKTIFWAIGVMFASLAAAIAKMVTTK